jgi:hypothetical protein
MSYKLNQNLGPGGWLIQVLPELKKADVVKAFGQGEYYGEDEKGYGANYSFEGLGDEHYTLYERYGVYRVGGYSGDSEKFIAWLKEQVA